jgi:hypothetical protein
VPILEKSMSAGEPPNGTIEPKNIATPQGPNEANTSQRLNLLRDVKEVRTNERKLKILVRKVYHFFRSSKIDDQAKGVVRKCRPHRFNLN